jgi:ATP-dependent RNA helicase DDX19/DBP5
LLQKVLHKGLVENKYDIEIERRNPKSPLFSVKSFEALNLKPELLKVWKLVILIKVLHV